MTNAESILSGCSSGMRVLDLGLELQRLLDGSEPCAPNPICSDPVAVVMEYILSSLPFDDCASL
jgi:hypothetical protein